MPRRSPTIRSKLVTLVLACVVPASLMAIVLIGHDYQRARDHLLFSSLSTARAMMAVVDRDIASIEASLVALSTSPHLKTRDYRSFYEQAQVVLKGQRNSENVNIALLDLNGNQILNTRRQFDERLPRYSPTIGFEAIHETGLPVISDMFISDITKRPLLAIGVMVPSIDGNMQYSLHAGIYPERFEHILQQQKLPDEWIAAIFDSQGNIVARSTDMQRFVGKQASDSMLAHLKSGQELFVTTTHDGVDVHTVVSRSTMAKWTLAIGIPTELINHELRITMMWLILATITLLTSSLAAAWMIGGRIADSIHGLMQPALALGSGQIISVPPLNLREADEVGASLEKVSQMLNRAQHLANHDVLTGLANRALFNEMLEQHLAICQQNQTVLSLLYIDLDGFKSVNDRYGHDVGDRLLCNVASRLKGGSRSSDVVARIGGDEFAIIMVGVSKQIAVAAATKLIESLSGAYAIDNIPLHISASIGVASYPDSGVTSDVLVQRADTAMYVAKEKGRKRVETAD